MCVGGLQNTSEMVVFLQGMANLNVGLTGLVGLTALTLEYLIYTIFEQAARYINV